MKPMQNTTPKLPSAIIIEDDEVISFVLRLALIEAGYSVQVIHSGRDALSHLKSASPHLLLLDLKLPDVSGAEILSSMSQNSSHEDTCIFIVTAHARLAGEFSDHVEAILEKPIRIKELRELAVKYKPAEFSSFSLLGSVGSV